MIARPIRHRIRSHHITSHAHIWSHYTPSGHRSSRRRPFYRLPRKTPWMRGMSTFLCEWCAYRYLWWVYVPIKNFCFVRNYEILRVGMCHLGRVHNTHTHTTQGQIQGLLSTRRRADDDSKLAWPLQPGSCHASTPIGPLVVSALMQYHSQIIMSFSVSLRSHPPV